MEKRAWPMRILTAVWHWLDRLRKFLHLIVLLFIFLVLIFAAIEDRVVVPGAAALVIAPKGNLVDQLSGDPLTRTIARARGTPLQETLVRDFIDALHAARDDARIKAVVLQLDGMGGGGLSKLQEVAAEIAHFRESGKAVIAVGDGFSRDQYYLAANADRVYMHPMGMVLIDGYSRYLPYYKSALDKLYIDYNVWTVGEYKSFVEPITRDGISPQDEEASRAYLGALWNAYQADVTTARKLPGPALQTYADDIVKLLTNAGGDAAKLAVDYGLVDELLTRDAMRERIRTAVGEEATPEKGDDNYTSIDLDDYVRSLDLTRKPARGTDKVAVIVASGTILDGRQPSGSIGGDSLAELIRKVRLDTSVKALVLRVDSGGGSAFASDVILRELQVFQDSGRPLVVSMSSVAASGGYWISMAANEIWASATTLTGSIGVGATIPTFPRTLAALGVHVDGVGTTQLSGAFDTTRPMSDALKGLIRESVKNTYAEFVSKVAEHRGRTPEQIEAAAQGRVWVGTDALDRGLVDHLGTFADALKAAASLAKLAEGRYSVAYIEPDLTFSERLAMSFAAEAVPLVDRVFGLPHWSAVVAQAVESALEPLAFIARWNDPRGVYAYCLCDVQ
ncbi:MAG: signal peptide peptidase SppA [Gammaproteobacteria bacterium]